MIMEEVNRIMSCLEHSPHILDGLIGETPTYLIRGARWKGLGWGCPRLKDDGFGLTLSDDYHIKPQRFELESAAEKIRKAIEHVVPRDRARKS